MSVKLKSRLGFLISMGKSTFLVWIYIVACVFDTWNGWFSDYCFWKMSFKLKSHLGFLISIRKSTFLVWICIVACVFDTWICSLRYSCFSLYPPMSPTARSIQINEFNAFFFIARKRRTYWYCVLYEYATFHFQWHHGILLWMVMTNNSLCNGIGDFHKLVLHFGKHTGCCFQWNHVMLTRGAYP